VRAGLFPHSAAARTAIAAIGQWLSTWPEQYRIMKAAVHAPRLHDRESAYLTNAGIADTRFVKPHRQSDPAFNRQKLISHSQNHRARLSLPCAVVRA